MVKASLDLSKGLMVAMDEPLRKKTCEHELFGKAKQKADDTTSCLFASETSVIILLKTLMRVLFCSVPFNKSHLKESYMAPYPKDLKIRCVSIITPNKIIQQRTHAIIVVK